jgi:hypothetical protein
MTHILPYRRQLQETHRGSSLPLQSPESVGEDGTNVATSADNSGGPSAGSQVSGQWLSFSLYFFHSLLNYRPPKC